MDAIVRIGVSNALWAAALAVVAAALSPVVRRPALTHVLWLMVLLKLITPPLFAIPVHTGAARPASINADLVVQRAVTLHSAATIPAPGQPRPRSHASLASSMYWAALAAWVAGAVIIGIVAAMRLHRFSKLLRFATPAPPHEQAQARQLAQRLGLRRCPAVCLLAGPVCPMLWAPLLRPRLILPADLWDRLSLRQRSALLLHELAHLKRKDHWVRALELISLTLFWWHPAAWWARHELREAEEQCCDAWVTWALPAGNQDYASALVEAVEFVSVPHRITGPMLPALASGIGEFRHLKRRLVMIQQGNSNRTLGKVGILCACAAAALLPLTLSRAQQSDRATTGPPSQHAATQPADQPEVDPGLRKQLDRQLPDVNFEAVGLSDVIDFLRDVSGSNIIVNWKALESAGIDRNAPVTARLRNVKLSKCLTLILDSTAGKPGLLVWQPDGNVLLITAGSDEGKIVQRTYDVHDLLAGGGGKEDLLVRMITDSIDADSWKNNGGKVGTIKIDSGKLVISQTESNQKAIANLVGRARELMKSGR